MSDINFLQPEEDKNADKSSRQYSIDYTSPKNGKAAAPSKKGGLFRRKGNAKAPRQAKKKIEEDVDPNAELKTAARPTAKGKLPKKKKSTDLPMGPMTGGTPNLQPGPLATGVPTIQAPNRSGAGVVSVAAPTGSYSNASNKPARIPMAPPPPEHEPVSIQQHKAAAPKSSGLPPRAQISQKPVQSVAPTAAAPRVKQAAAQPLVPPINVNPDLPQFVQTAKRPTIPVAPPPPVHAQPVPHTAKRHTKTTDVGQQHIPTQQPTIQAASVQQLADTSGVQDSVAATAVAHSVPNESLPNALTLEEKHIPGAPLPPVHEAPIHEAVKPAAPSSPASPAVEPASPALTRQTSSTADIGRIHAQRVSKMKGKQTDPQRVTRSAFNVNLLPQEISEEFHRDPAGTRILKLALATLTVVGLAYVGMVLYEGYYINQTVQTQEEIRALELDILSYRGLQTDIGERNDAIEQVSGVLDQHVYWTEFFSELEAYTMPNVKYVSFSGNVLGQISLQAVTDDFASVSRQVAVFEDADGFVERVNVTAASRGSLSAETAEPTEGEEVEAILLEEDESTEASEEEAASGVTFSMSLQVNPDIFYYGL